MFGGVPAVLFTLFGYSHPGDTVIREYSLEPSFIAIVIVLFFRGMEFLLEVREFFVDTISADPLPDRCGGAIRIR